MFVRNGWVSEDRSFRSLCYASLVGWGTMFTYRCL